MSAAPPWRASATATASHSNGAPAYIPVQARRHLSGATTNQASSHGSAQPSSTSSTQASRAKKVDWPETVREYVQRSFAPENQIAEVSRAEMEIKLREIITKAAGGSADGGSLHNIDWENLPLPQQMVLSERNKTATGSSASQALSPSAKPGMAVDYSQKRKSTEFNSAQDETGRYTPPWRRTANPRNEYEDRASYLSPSDKRRRINDVDDKPVSKFKHTLESRRRRFELSNSGSQTPSTLEPDEIGKATPDSGPIVGTCQKLEKNYFRLTAPPRPESVRPLEVLMKTLDLLKRKWKEENNYGYICDQFKSLRQDLTVQHIKNEFTVRVYENHARIALEKGDLGEYNQCQTQLRALYARKLGGRPMEFKAYRILYFIYTRNQTAINDILANLTPAEKMDEAVSHALEVRSAIALGNYHRFFQLYLDAPNMGAYLLDMFIDRERLSALACICKSYKPSVPLRFITEELGFDSDQQAGQFIVDRAPAELLEEQNGVVKFLAGKAGNVFAQAKAEANRLIDIKGQI